MGNSAVAMLHLHVNGRKYVWTDCNRVCCVMCVSCVVYVCHGVCRCVVCTHAQFLPVRFTYTRMYCARSTGLQITSGIAPKLYNYFLSIFRLTEAAVREEQHATWWMMLEPGPNRTGNGLRQVLQCSSNK